MRDNMFVKLSANGHFMPVDLCMEHLIGALKVTDCSRALVLLIRSTEADCC
jgi:hypothetical protein